MATCYQTYNGLAPTTAAFVKVTTGTSLKTMLQIATSSVRPIKIIEWGISFDGSAAGTPVQCELIDTGSVAATVTAHVAAGVAPFDDPNGPASTVTLGASATGYTSTIEGTITFGRLLDEQNVQPSGQYVKQFPLGREPQLAVSKILRVRVLAAAAVNCTTYITFEE